MNSATRLTGTEMSAMLMPSRFCASLDALAQLPPFFSRIGIGGDGEFRDAAPKPDRVA
jgi:hypothetical protein